MDETKNSIEDKKNIPSQYKNTTPTKKFILINSIVSLLIFLLYTLLAIAEGDICLIFGAFF